MQTLRVCRHYDTHWHPTTKSLIRVANGALELHATEIRQELRYFIRHEDKEEVGPTTFVCLEGESFSFFMIQDTYPIGATQLIVPVGTGSSCTKWYR